VDRRQFLKLASVAAGTRILDLPFVTPASAQQPNIIWIMADDLGHGDLGCYGQQGIQTPNIDAMASEGMCFTQAYSAAPVCSPARWCLMTGRSPKSLPTVRNDARLEAGDVTVAQVLKLAGYTTALVGKWGLGETGNGLHPNDAGFDLFYGYFDHFYAHLYYPHTLWRNQCVDLLQENWTGNARYSHDLFIDEALCFIESADRPYFLYLPLTLPHTNNELATLTGDGLQVPEVNSAYCNCGWKEIDARYATMVSTIDRDVGRILGVVRGSNTLVIFTSDNGPNYASDYTGFFSSTRGLRGSKSELYEGGIRIPMIAWWPRVIQPGASDYMWSFTDFLATAADLAGIGAPPTDGISIVPILMGTDIPVHPPLYWRYIKMQAARAGNWKVVQNGDLSPELYDLETDPGETTDLSLMYPGLAGEILAEATRHRAYMPYIAR
jgi:arylsulfatase A-like enzyme